MNPTKNGNFFFNFFPPKKKKKKVKISNSMNILPGKTKEQKENEYFPIGNLGRTKKNLCVRLRIIYSYSRAGYASTKASADRIGRVRQMQTSRGYRKT
jgi:hypothetical protein